MVIANLLTKLVGETGQKIVEGLSYLERDRSLEKGQAGMPVLPD
jgi:predicted component of type VI protein secretion system